MSDPAPLHYRDLIEEARVHTLTAELRCVQCQNQSLADSQAPVAQDLRHQVVSLMRQGHSDARIKQFLVDRYGIFVLYRPPLQNTTLVLWFGPLVFLLAGVMVVVRMIRRYSATTPNAP
ncbi:MAG TPA: cytochrome c-type biogenesis protein [Xylella sp.]